MIIIENEIKRLDLAKEQLNLIKECLWLKQIKLRNCKIQKNATCP